MTVTRQIAPDQKRRKRRNCTRVGPEIDAYTIAISLVAGFLAEWPIELTRKGARVLRRGDDVIAEAQRAVMREVQ